MNLLAATLSPTYNCAHFVCDAWEDEIGHDIRHVLSGFLVVADERQASPRLITAMRRIHAPVGPCLVLFRRLKASPHVGLFNRGRVLHLTDSGPIRQLLDVARIGYHSVRFYVPR